MFVKPLDGVKFALLAQAAMRLPAAASGQTLAVRIGIHAGEVFIEDNDQTRHQVDLYGIQVDSGARLMCLAQGEQILLTRFVFDNARQLLKGEGLPGWGRFLAQPWVLSGQRGGGADGDLRSGRIGGGALSRPPDRRRRAGIFRRRANRCWAGVQRSGSLCPTPTGCWSRSWAKAGLARCGWAGSDNLKERRVFKFCFKCDRVRSSNGS